MYETAVVNSMEAMINTIHRDPFAKNWFYFFLRQPRVKARVCSSPELMPIYRRLERMGPWLALGEFVFAAALVVPALTADYIYWAAAFALWWALEIFTVPQRKCIADIMRKLMEADFPDDSHRDTDPAAGRGDSGKLHLRNLTLYQVCERYARAEGIPGLVEAIFLHDLIARWVVAFSITVIFWSMSGILRLGRGSLF